MNKKLPTANVTAPKHANGKKLRLTRELFRQFNLFLCLTNTKNGKNGSTNRLNGGTAAIRAP